MIEHAVQELPSALVRRIDEKMFGVALLGNHAFIHEYDPVGGLTRKPHFMRDDHHGHAVAREPTHDLGDFADQFRIQCGRRFVERT